MLDRSTPTTWAILPVKNADSAKRRLSDVLSAAERRQLFYEMFADVMAAISDSRTLAGLAIVSRDPGVIKVGNRLGARIFEDDIGGGQSAAVSFGAASLAKEGVERTISIPGDVPLLSGTEIDAVCCSIENAPSVTIVPNLNGTGTNGLACSPPAIIPYEFGTNSFARHRSSARNVDLDVCVQCPPGLCLDIDVHNDLIALLHRETTTRTQAYLIDSGVAARLCVPEHAAATGSRSQ